MAKLGRIDAEFVSDRDAYLVDESELRFTAPKTDVDALAEGLVEYKELKARLLIEAAIVGAAISAALLPTLGSEIAATFFAGVGAGVAYLLLLESESDALGADEPPPKAIALAASARLAVPLVLVSLLAAGNLVGGRATSALSTVPKEQFFAGVAGFLSYKLPLLARQFARAIKELSQEGAQAPVEKGGLSTGSLGMMVRLAKESKEAKARAAEAAEGEEAKAAASAPRQVVLCGPSGVGKSTLIAKLVEAAPAALSFSVSSTTRPPRAGEADGVDYNFVSAAAFDEMVAAGEFIEWAQVGDHKYGTSVGAIEQVTADGRVCLLDVDVQGVKALRTQPALRPFYVGGAAVARRPPPAAHRPRHRGARRGRAPPRARRLRGRVRPHRPRLRPHADQRRPRHRLRRAQGRAREGGRGGRRGVIVRPPSSQRDVHSSDSSVARSSRRSPTQRCSSSARWRMASSSAAALEAAPLGSRWRCRRRRRASSRSSRP